VSARHPWWTLAASIAASAAKKARSDADPPKSSPAKPFEGRFFLTTILLSICLLV